MNEAKEIFEKLINGLDTKYIKDLKVMKVFNAAKTSDDREKVMRQFFDEIIRMLLELKMAHIDSAFWYDIVTNNLDYHFRRMYSVLHIDFETATKLKEELLK